MFPSAGIIRHMMCLVLWLVKVEGMSLKYEVLCFFHFTYFICSKKFQSFIEKRLNLWERLGFSTCLYYEKRERQKFCVMLWPELEVRLRFSFLFCSYRGSKLNAIWKNLVSYKNKQTKRFVHKIRTSNAHIHSDDRFIFLKKPRALCGNKQQQIFPYENRFSIYVLNLSRIFPLFLSRQVGAILQQCM